MKELLCTPDESGRKEINIPAINIRFRNLFYLYVRGCISLLKPCFNNLPVEKSI